MPTPRAAVEHYARQRRVMVATLGVARRLWGDRPPGDFDDWFHANGPALVSAVVAGQRAAVDDAGRFTNEVLDELGTPVAPDADVDTGRLVGVASDGRALDSLLFGSIITTKAAVGRGETLPAAWASGRSSLLTRVQTQVADASRVAVGLEVAVRRRVGYVRMLNPPSCSRCVVLAGRFYRYNAGFRRHPGCFPAGTVVHGPKASHATRRWFEGELVTLATAGGQELSLTGNHPVLTGRGWVPANLVQEGDEVVRSTRTEGATPLVVPDHHQVPTRIEDLWGAFAMFGVERVPTATEDFHGDGGHGEVDVVSADGALGLGYGPSLPEELAQHHLTGGSGHGIRLAEEGLASVAGFGSDGTPGGLVGAPGLGLALVGGHPAGADKSGSGTVATLDTCLEEMAADDVTAHAVLAAKGVFGHSGLVGSRELGDGQGLPDPRWDAPAGPLTVQSGPGYTERGRDLLDRLAGQVELERVVVRRSRNWAGHVYNLTSVEGWHTANGLIVSNCDCRAIPSTEATAGGLTVDPRAYFDSLSPEMQDKTFTAAGAEAIRAGADVSQVVNTRRAGELYTASAYGREIAATREGTTRRGVAHKAMTQARYIRDGAELKSGRYRGLRAPRLMPEAIGQIADDRDDYLRLLQLYGYIR